MTAKKAGTAVVIATTSNGKTASCTVTVSVPTVDDTGVTLNKTELSLSVGGSATLTATVTPANATVKTVTWRSSDALVITVKNGVVTAVGVGTATVMRALSSLTDGNRLVGIISHVNELKSRIDKQIVVTKDKSGGSKASIII